jgi:hydrogenase expression/formation protein HypE
MADNEIKAVFFDFDGTLTSPGALDFPKIKLAIGCPADSPILEFIDSLASESEKNTARHTLDTFEMAAAALSRPGSGCERLLKALKDRQLKIGIISRNSPQSIAKAFENFVEIGMDAFDVIISRDSPAAIKPAPDGILLAAQELGLPPHRVIMVGDYVFDLRAGRAAGTHTVLIDTGGHRAAWDGEYDFAIDTLDELPAIIDLGAPLPTGKLPNSVLEEFIDSVQFADPSILIGPGVGEDTAALDISGQEVLVLKSDPITFVANDIGTYAVIVNANDIATSGAAPRWMLTTLLFPPGATALQIRRTMLEIRNVCADLGISLCGGHTEITDAVTRPVVTGLMAGLVTRSDLLDKDNLRPGDRILLTKQVAVEGTAILAAEFRKQLTDRGISQETLLACEGYLAMLSILPEARLAAGHPGTVAMHDVTEGGLATALFELSCVAGYRLKIEMNKIPVFEHTRELCQALGLNPLGLIGSGSLLIACRPEHQASISRRIKNAAIEVTCIGEVAAKGRGIEARENGCKAKWPDFAVDELARLFH